MVMLVRRRSWSRIFTPGQFRNPFHAVRDSTGYSRSDGQALVKPGDDPVAVEIPGGLPFGVGRGGPVLLTKVLVAYRGGLAGIPGKSPECCCRRIVSLASHFLEITSNNKHQ